jgi:hypothetical protein
MTVVKLPSGRLWLHSPIRLDEALVEALSRLGPIAHVVAPNSIHYWWIRDWSDRFPEAQVWAVARLAAGARLRVPAHFVIGGQPPSAWEGVLDQETVSGARIVEADFFHRPSKTLILTDLIENFEGDRFNSFFYRWLARLGGAIDPDGKLPLDLRRSFPADELKRAVERMLAWSPEKIIIAHGRWYKSEGRAELQRAFRWLR